MDLDPLNDLGTWMDNASASRQLPNPNLPVDSTGATNEANSALYIRALRSRLVSLGYLKPSQAQQDGLTVELRAAIFAFQRQAGLTLDGWAGPATKKRLQQLVSFEDGQDTGEWGELGQRPADFPAVSRALYLRLYTLGFLDWGEKLGPDTMCRLDENLAFLGAFRRFLEVAQELGLSDRTFETELDARTLRLLFGHDRLIQALAERQAVVDAPVQRRFVDAIGRVELWLLGYDVTIAGEQQKREGKRVHRGPRDTIGSVTMIDPVADALADFEERFPSARAAAAPNRFSAAFFGQMQQIGAARDDAADPGLQDQILERVGANAASIATKLGQLASRIWDGVKRVWAWLKASVKGALKAAENELWNIARIVAHGARESYEAVLKALDIVHRGVVCLRRRSAIGSDAQRSVLHFATDYDSTLFMNAAAGIEPALDLVLADARETRFLATACHIVGLLVAALHEVIRVVSIGVAEGWLLLLLGLSRIVRELRSMRDEIDDLAMLEIGGDTIYVNQVV